MSNFILEYSVLPHSDHISLKIGFNPEKGAFDQKTVGTAAGPCHTVGPHKCQGDGYCCAYSSRLHFILILTLTSLST